MLKDIEIALQANIKPINEIAKILDISEDNLQLYGKYKAKISEDFINNSNTNKEGKLVLITVFLFFIRL